MNKSNITIVCNYSNYSNSSCIDNDDEGMKDTLFIIIMYSICLCFCLYPLCIKFIDKTKDKIYENRINKYYKHNDIDSMVINNPCYGLDIDIDTTIDIDTNTDINQ